MRTIESINTIKKSENIQLHIMLDLTGLHKLSNKYTFKSLEILFVSCML
uniref:Uncharacterized protein n=1 Tax=viral metagenome TaxID=1070528 RepID=A0A6C0E6F8_9ZZZZ